MSFANPEFLLLLPLAALVAWRFARHRHPALRFSDPSRFAGHRGWRAAVAERASVSLRALACLLLVVACAGPRAPDLTTRIPAEGIAVMMALDVSGSMDAEDVAWTAGSPPVSRLEAARRAFKLFVLGGDAPDGTNFKARTGDAVGLVTFAAVPQTVCPLTLMHPVLEKVVDEQRAKGGPDAGTNIGDALGEAIERLDAVKTKRRSKVLILLSDGEHNVFREDVPNAKDPGVNRTLRPREAAQLAVNLGIRVYTIDCGGEPPTGAPADAAQQRLEGRAALRSVAEMTGGKSFSAASGAEFLEAYREIGLLEKTIIEAPIYRRHYEFYVWCAAAALVCILASQVLERTLLRVVTRVD
jgi:Ca-activated chloride channel family protein